MVSMYITQGVPMFDLSAFPENHDVHDGGSTVAHPQWLAPTYPPCRSTRFTHQYKGNWRRCH